MNCIMYLYFERCSVIILKTSIRNCLVACLFAIVSARFCKQRYLIVDLELILSIDCRFLKIGKIEILPKQKIGYIWIIEFTHNNPPDWNS
jgi:hypothetical protein